MNSTILAFILASFFFMAVLWPDKHHLMKVLNIILKAIGELRDWLAFRVRCWQTNRKK